MVEGAHKIGKRPQVFYKGLGNSEELGIRSEEWWKGRTKLGSAPIPLFICNWLFVVGLYAGLFWANSPRRKWHWFRG